LSIQPPLGYSQLVSESYSPKKSLIAWRDDVEDQGNTRSPTKFDEEGNPITIEEDSKTGASNAREAYD
jgi:hypothetical protein